jgi:hypothetical protein
MSSLARRLVEDEDAGDLVAVAAPDAREADVGADFAPPAARSLGSSLAARYRAQNFGGVAPAASHVPEATPIAFAPLTPTPFVAPRRAAALERNDFLAYVAKNETAFAPLYDAQLQGGRWRRALCWPALFAPVGWLMYRKMYGTAAALAVTPVVLAYLGAPPLVLSLCALAARLTAWYGRPFYVWMARRRIAEIRASAKDEATALDAIARAGGVSRAGVAIGVLMLLTVSVSLHPTAHHS